MAIRKELVSTLKYKTLFCYGRKILIYKLKKECLNKVKLNNNKWK